MAAMLKSALASNTRQGAGSFAKSCRRWRKALRGATLKHCALLLLVLLSAPLHVRQVSAHAEYDRSDPPADATLTEVPTQVRIWFTQELFRREGQNSIEVQNEAGQRVDMDDLSIDDDDRTLMSVSLAPGLVEGRYRVLWRATSVEDGHESEGEFAFTLAATGVEENIDTTSTTAVAASDAEEVMQETATPTVMPAAELPSPTPSPAPGGSAGLPCASGAVPLLLVLGALLVQRRNVAR